MDKETEEALVAAYSILSLLQYRGIVDSQWNREDIAKAAAQVGRVLDRASHA